MSLERDLTRIANKSQMHKWIDDLPNNAVGVVLVEYGDPTGETLGFHASFTFGEDVTLSTLTWLAQNYIYRTVRHANES